MLNIQAPDTPASHPDAINLRFDVESQSSLWNIVFEGFEEDVDIISEFVGSTEQAVALLHALLHALGRTTKAGPSDFRVFRRPRGISIVKTFPIGEPSRINEWTDLMSSVGDEVSRLVERGAGAHG